MAGSPSGNLGLDLSLILPFRNHRQQRTSSLLYAKHRHCCVLGNQEIALHIQRQVPSVHLLGIGLIGLLLIVIMNQGSGSVRYQHISFFLHRTGPEIRQKYYAGNLQASMLLYLFTEYPCDKTVILYSEKTWNFKSLLCKLQVDIYPVIPIFVGIGICLNRFGKTVSRKEIALIIHIGQLQQGLYPGFVLAECHRILRGILRIASPLCPGRLILYSELHKGRLKIQLQTLILGRQFPAFRNSLYRFRLPCHLLIGFFIGRLIQEHHKTDKQTEHRQINQSLYQELSDFDIVYFHAYHPLTHPEYHFFCYRHHKTIQIRGQVPYQHDKE